MGTVMNLRDVVTIYTAMEISRYISFIEYLKTEYSRTFYECPEIPRADNICGFLALSFIT